MQEQWTVDGFELVVTRKRGMKHVYFRVAVPEGYLKVSAAPRVTKRFLTDYVREHAEELREMQRRALTRYREEITEYRTGEMLPLFGKKYPLVVLPGNTVRMELLDSESLPEVNDLPEIRTTVTDAHRVILLRVRKDTDRDGRERAAEEFYRRELAVVLPEAIRRAEERTGLSAEEYRLRRMKTRWGTCSIRAKRIWLSVHLAKKPAECLDYILVHELVHLLEPYHNRRFYRLVEGFYPGYKAVEGLLRKRENGM